MHYTIQWVGLNFGPSRAAELSYRSCMSRIESGLLPFGPSAKASTYQTPSPTLPRPFPTLAKQQDPDVTSDSH